MGPGYRSVATPALAATRHARLGQAMAVGESAAASAKAAAIQLFVLLFFIRRWVAMPTNFGAGW